MKWSLVPGRANIHDWCTYNWAHKHRHSPMWTHAELSTLCSRAWGLGALFDSHPESPASDRHGLLSCLLGSTSLLLTFSGPHSADPVLLAPEPSLPG